MYGRGWRRAGQIQGHAADRSADGVRRAADRNAIDGQGGIRSAHRGVEGKASVVIRNRQGSRNAGGLTEQCQSRTAGVGYNARGDSQILIIDVTRQRADRVIHARRNRNVMGYATDFTDL